MKVCVFLVGLLMGLNGGFSGGGGERSSKNYIIRNDRLTFSPSGYAEGKSYLILNGPKRFMESATPVIYFVIPSRIPVKETPQVGIGGDNFLTFPSPPSVFVGSVSVKDVKVYGSTSIVFKYPGGLSAGYYDVKVVNSDGKVAIKQKGIEVFTPPPKIYSVMPSRIFEEEKKFVYVVGENFVEGITASLNSYPVPLSYVDSAHLFLKVEGLPHGIYTLSLYTDSGRAIMKGALQVMRKDIFVEKKEGCGCSEGGIGGEIIIFLAVFILLFRRRVYLLLLAITFSCGGKKEKVYKKNTPPVAVVETLQSGSVFEWLTLDGASSYDPDGDEIEYSWRIKNSPRNAVYYFLDENTATPVFMTETPGVYEFELIVHDGFLPSSPYSLTLPIKNEGVFPTPCFEVFPGRIGEFAQLRSDCSSVTSREGLIYTWELLDPPDCQIDTELPPIPNPSFTVQCPSGTVYTISLSLSLGNYTSYPFVLTMRVPNTPPFLSSIDDLYLPSGTTSFKLDASSIYDPDGDEVTCRWSVVYSDAPITPQVSYSCIQDFQTGGDGSYIMKLIFGDDSTMQEDYVTVRIGSPSPPSISSCSISTLPALKGNDYTVKVDFSCPIIVNRWNGNPALIRYKWEIEDYPYGATVFTLLPNSGWLSSYSEPLTFPLVVSGTVKNVDFEPLSMRVRLILQSEETGFRFATDRKIDVAFSIPNSVPVIYVEDYAFEVHDDSALELYPVNMRGRDEEGDSLTYTLSILFFPPDVSFYLGGGSGASDRVFSAGFYERKKGIYVLRAIVEDEHGATAYKDFSITLK